jgi:flagellar assembly protein FliH
MAMSSSPDVRTVRTLLPAEAANDVVPARLDADLRSDGYAKAAVGTITVDPRMVDRRLQPAFLEHLREANEQAREAGLDEGYRAGYDAGMAAAAVHRKHSEAREQERVAERDAVLAQALSAVEAAARAFDERSAPVFEQLEEAAIEAAVEIAETILGQKLPSALVAQASLRRAMSLAESHGTHTARMNPTDMVRLQEAGLQLSGLSLVADPAVAPGDCVLQDGYASIEVMMATALERVRSELGLPQRGAAA